MEEALNAVEYGAKRAAALAGQHKSGSTAFLLFRFFIFFLVGAV